MSKLQVIRSVVWPSATMPRIETAHMMFRRLRGVRNTSESRPPAMIRTTSRIERGVFARKPHDLSRPPLTEPGERHPEARRKGRGRLDILGRVSCSCRTDLTRPRLVSIKRGFRRARVGAPEHQLSYQHCASRLATFSGVTGAVGARIFVGTCRPCTMS